MSSREKENQSDEVAAATQIAIDELPSDVLFRAADRKIQLPGPALRALRKKLGLRVFEKRGGSKVLSQDAVAEAMRKHSVSRPLSAKVISSRELQAEPICVLCAAALAKAFWLIEEEHGLRDSDDHVRKADLVPLVSPRYSYSKQSTMDMLSTDEGFPLADSVAFDAVVFRPDANRIKAMLRHSVVAEQFGNSSPDLNGVANRLAVAITIRLTNLRGTDENINRPLTLNHVGNDGSLWLLADGSFGRNGTTGKLSDGSRAFPSQEETDAVHFRRGICVDQSPSAELSCEPVNAPWLSSGSLLYVVNARGDVTIRLAILGAFDKARQMTPSVGLPITALAERVHVAVAFDRSVNNVIPPSGLEFHTYPDTRVHRGPAPNAPTEPGWKVAPEDSRLLDADSPLAGRRMTIGRPHLGDVYAFTWPPIK